MPRRQLNGRLVVFRAAHAPVRPGICSHDKWVLVALVVTLGSNSGRRKTIAADILPLVGAAAVTIVDVANLYKVAGLLMFGAD